MQLPPASLNVLIEGGRIGRVGVQFGLAGSWADADRGRTTATAAADAIAPAIDSGWDDGTAGSDTTVPRCRRLL